MVSFGIRTLAGVGTLVEWMRAEGVTAMDASARVEELVSLLAPMANPAHAERHRKALECERVSLPAQPSPESPESPSPATSPSAASSTPTQEESPHP
jgi:hypothetical protein